MIQQPGTYTLILYAKEPFIVEIGKLGELQGKPGYYLYCGSAFGTGGLTARLNHHCHIAKRPHWHIDYLRKKIALSHIWYSHDPIKREHDWAQLLGGYSTASFPQLDFGSSDCKCPSHLIYFPQKPTLAEFQRKISRHAVSYGKLFPIFETQSSEVSK